MGRPRAKHSQRFCPAIGAIVKEAELCDFCSSPHPEWTHPCRDFLITSGLSVGGFTACGACHAIIMLGNLEALIARAATAFHVRRPDVPVEALVELVRPIHAGFWLNRKGEPVRG